ncbi:MAG: LPS assembly protein LptD [Alphaproteobacteria bacterium]|nr:LPS assembly protein LptD [Alphaproteobacteria bacterium]
MENGKWKIFIFTFHFSLFTLFLAYPAFAEMPPIGYTGVAPQPVIVREIPPIGYVGIAPNSTLHSPLSILEEEDRYKNQTLISADSMDTDSETGVVTARGNVEIVYNDNVLRADEVSYNQKTGVMMAIGNVVIVSENQETFFADKYEITGDMKQAFARDVGVLFPDNSRMAAKTIVKYDERYTVADKGAYTACNVCRENPDKPPLWQLRADTVTHDKEEKNLYYHNAVLDFLGLPVFYTPYMSMPDPTVDRRSGFLIPLGGKSANIGLNVRLPYYWDIAPDKDLLITPNFNEEDTLQLSLAYRQRFAHGNLELFLSGTHGTLISDTGVNKGNRWRGNIFGNYRQDLTNTWRMGADADYVSDKSYLARYRISTKDQTRSRLYAERFHGRDYFAVNSYYFQDLRPGERTADPVVAPYLYYQAFGSPAQTLGGRWSFDASLLNTIRDNSGKPINLQGPDTRRLSLKSDWQREFISDTGLATTVSGLVRLDSWWADNVVNYDLNRVYNDVLFTRPFAQADILMRYPLTRRGEHYQQVLEPTVAFTVAPKLRQRDNQPIEDSFIVEFDETNLFSANRYTGNDLLEGGSRFTYGLRNMIIADNGFYTDFFGGMSYSFDNDDKFSEESGLRNNLSSFVGRVNVAVAPWFNANYGFRISSRDFSLQRQDAFVSLGVPEFRPSLRYIQAYHWNAASNNYENIRQAVFGLNSNIYDYWHLGASHTQAFSPNPGPRTTAVRLYYLDECFASGIEFTKENTNRLDIKSGAGFVVFIKLRNIGGLSSGSLGAMEFPVHMRN